MQDQLYLSSPWTEGFWQAITSQGLLGHSLVSSPPRPPGGAGSGRCPQPEASSVQGGLPAGGGTEEPPTGETGASQESGGGEGGRGASR